MWLNVKHKGSQVERRAKHEGGSETIFLLIHFPPALFICSTRNIERSLSKQKAVNIDMKLF